jgi:hypothetical protein
VGAAQSHGDDIPVAGLALIGGGLLAETIGLIFTLNAEPHLMDAINAYNDGLDAPAKQAR